MNDFAKDIEQCLSVLNRGGIILYPTDTVWGIGCDATNENAVNKIFTLKKREDSKSMIILISDKLNITDYVDAPNVEIMNFISKTTQPTTVIYDNVKNVAKSLINKDGSIAIRIVRDDFCVALINKFKKPIVSTSANNSGMPAPAIFNTIQPEIKNGVDYIVQHRQRDFRVAKPSAIIKLSEEGKIIVLRP